MFKRYSEIVDRRLDEIVSVGWTHITWRELCCWYEVSHVTKEVWLDIQSRLGAVLREPSVDVGANIYVIGTKENGFILAKTTDCQRLSNVVDSSPD